MSNKGNALVSLIVLALGVVFLWLCNRADFLHSVVMLCGVAFILPAVISLLSMFFEGKRNRQSAGLRLIQMVCGVGGLGLGACILLMPGTFRALLVFLFAALLIAGGAFQVFLVSHKSRPVNYPSWLLVVPIVVLVAGVVMLCIEAFHNPENERWVVVLTGVAFVLYGLNGLVVSIVGARGRSRKVAESEPRMVEAHGAEPSEASTTTMTTSTSTHVKAGYGSDSPSVSRSSDRFDSESATDVKGH